MKISFTIALMLSLSPMPSVLSCDCHILDLKTQLKQSKEIFVGELLSIDKTDYEFLVLKSWRGIIKKDTITVHHSTNDCYIPNLSFHFPDEFFLVYLDENGIHNCSRSVRYLKSRDIKNIDSLFNKTIWVNEKAIPTLTKLEFARRYIISTDNGSIYTGDKKVVYNFEGKILDYESLPSDLNYFYPMHYYLISNGHKNNCGIDYVIYIVLSHQGFTMSEKRRGRLERKSLKMACR